ncbi:Mannitol 2-dehydrogenase [Jannaschia rubra]|uniref:Mannitol 2-dehydrogenase n=1 Tax=Jannaschia rubra TaxID=282197 RepID=A0A0M6XWF2_9RHOB|nr:Mannitol 2-dehydrogenase [Jannaschia rubra]SFG71704.1 mannitol 2-dehydrogenase [Jannaschia rubra]
MALHLSLATLDDLPPEVARPGYDRADLSPGILHIGVGNFHRAHMAVYLDRLFSMGADHDWAIVGAGVRPFDAARREVLAAQDWLTTVVELDPEGLAARVTGSMVDFLPVDGPALIRAIADPAIRIVSMTITEGGYFVDARSGAFDATHPDIRADAAGGEPRTVFGLLIAGLAARRAAGHPPPTILSCDNLPRNGHVTREAVLGLAGLMDEGLRDWIAGTVAFPDSMVDCITPATSTREIALVRDRFGIDDAAPVACEPFRQWVLEDRFPLGRPALDRVGATFVDDVAPYETMKLRILNAGHAAIAYAGALRGHVYVHDAMADPLIEGWLRRLMTEEVIPVLPAIPGVDFHAYLDTCIGRFANPRVGDTVARLCQDGSNRQPKFVLPTVADARAAGAPVDLLAMEVALWCRYCADPATDLDDARADALRSAARATRDDPGAFLRLEEVFGPLGRDEVFAGAFAGAIGQLWSRPVEEVLSGVSSDPSSRMRAASPSRSSY